VVSAAQQTAVHWRHDEDDWRDGEVLAGAREGRNGAAGLFAVCQRQIRHWV